MSSMPVLWILMLRLKGIPMPVHFKVKDAHAAQVTHPARDAEGLKDAPGEGVFVHGLFLDGCAWSNRENRLVDAEPKKLFHALPVLYITGILVRAKVARNCSAGLMACLVFACQQ